MESLFESLESRTMLSAAPSVTALKAEGKVVIADTVAVGKVVTANLKLIKADLKAADETKSSSALVKTLSVEGAAAFAVTTGGVAKTITLIASDLSKLVSADEQTLQTDSTNRLAAITNDLTAEQSTNTTNITALVTANPSNTQLATDASTTIPENADAANTALSDAVTTALTTGVIAVIAAFPS